MEVCFSGF